MVKILSAAVGGAALVAAVLGSSVAMPAAAETVVLQGIGTLGCKKLLTDVKPTEGLANTANVMLYAWVQGYVSAANVALLEDEGKHVDMGTLDGGRVLGFIIEFCKANPEGKAIAAIDELIRQSDKIPTKWDAGTVSWDD
jgi:hypothetical protein